VLPVSFHTLLAASILTFTVGMAVLTWAPGERTNENVEPSGLGAAVHGT